MKKLIIILALIITFISACGKCKECTTILTIENLRICDTITEEVCGHDLEDIDGRDITTTLKGWEVKYKTVCK